MTPGARRASAGRVALLALGALILARVALAGWWLATDARVTDNESSRHLALAWDLLDGMAAGDLLRGFEAGNLYPPLHHLIGVAGLELFGADPDASMLMQSLVVIPAFAIGVYGVGATAYGRTAGVLAAAFALAAPMAVSAFHMFLIDTPQMALVALCVWGILASRRFERTGVAALAGLAGGLGMLTKQNFALFVAGVVLVALARGGWRHWRGFGVFLLVGALVSVTWYWSELDRTFGLVQGGSLDQPATEAAGDIRPSRWSTKNIGWYVWHTLNNQLLVPMTLAFVAGSVALGARWLRRRRPDDVTPELIAGGLVTFLGLTWISLKDPRYALPAYVYMAVLGTGWMTLLPRRGRTAAIAVLAVVCLVNVVGTVADRGDRIAAVLPGAPDPDSVAREFAIAERHFTVYKPGGWLVGEPYDDSEILDMLRAARADGIRRIDFDPGAREASFNQSGLDYLRRIAGIPRGSVFQDRFGRRDAFVTGRWPGQDQVAAEPCARLEGDGRRVYMTRGDINGIPFERWPEYYCPLRRDGTSAAAP